MDFGINMLLTWIGCYAVIGLYEKVWQWTETALPPASMIDKSSMDSSVEQSTPSAKPEPPDNLPEAEYTETVRIASDHYCLGAPLLETVAVQSWLIESSIAVLTIVTLAGLGVGKIEVVNDAILAHPTISTLIALTLFVPALLIGALRQVFGCLLSHAAAIPVIDGYGQPRFCYLGDVPTPRWQHSPWFRAITWVLVAGGSLIGAWIGSLYASQSFDVGALYVFFAVVGLRWLISAIPALLYRSSIAGQA